MVRKITLGVSTDETVAILPQLTGQKKSSERRKGAGRTRPLFCEHHFGCMRMPASKRMDSAFM